MHTNPHFIKGLNIDYNEVLGDPLDKNNLLDSDYTINKEDLRKYL